MGAWHSESRVEKRVLRADLNADFNPFLARIRRTTSHDVPIKVLFTCYFQLEFHL